LKWCGDGLNSVETLALILTFSPGEKELPQPAVDFTDDRSHI